MGGAPAALAAAARREGRGRERGRALPVQHAGRVSLRGHIMSVLLRATLVARPPWRDARCLSLLSLSLAQQRSFADWSGDRAEAASIGRPRVLRSRSASGRGPPEAS